MLLEYEGEPEDFPKGIYEDETELDEAVDYLQELIGIQNDRALFNYGKSRIDDFWGVTLEELYSEALEIKRREEDVEELFFRRETRKSQDTWFKL
ncbi:hypothetical protein [Candidatus Nanohalobium constans]|uniref:Uncharacterized protein n=1 Tax=Candidatus Nanohalobium constans TaxID=2565781 RepID=A0A5Q0UI61_9ARCH|nr:hypothetical protein [Candidatus Nanohalobium constans]QGA80615.1 hypothetical protein LC1Nh_0728 [Candidatus Nanohalobium constans]